MEGIVRYQGMPSPFEFLGIRGAERGGLLGSVGNHQGALNLRLIVVIRQNTEFIALNSFLCIVSVVGFCMWFGTRGHDSASFRKKTSEKQSKTDRPFVPVRRLHRARTSGLIVTVGAGVYKKISFPRPYFHGMRMGNCRHRRARSHRDSCVQLSSSWCCMPECRGSPRSRSGR